MNFQVQVKEKLQSDLFIVEFEWMTKASEYIIENNPSRIFVLEHLIERNIWFSTIIVDDDFSRFAILPKFGESLLELFGTELSPLELRQLAHDVWSCIQEFHSAGIFHRDISLESIYYDIDLKRGFLYLFKNPGLMDASKNNDTFSPEQTFCARELNINPEAEYKKEFDLESLLYVLFYFTHRFLPWIDVDDRDPITIAAKKSQWIALSDFKRILEFSKSSIDSLFDALKHKFQVPLQSFDLNFRGSIASFIDSQYSKMQNIGRILEDILEEYVKITLYYAADLEIATGKAINFSVYSKTKHDKPNQCQAAIDYVRDLLNASGFPQLADSEETKEIEANFCSFVRKMDAEKASVMPSLPCRSKTRILRYSFKKGKFQIWPVSRELLKSSKSVGNVISDDEKLTCFEFYCSESESTSLDTIESQICQKLVQMMKSIVFMHFDMAYKENDSLLHKMRNDKKYSRRDFMSVLQTTFPRISDRVSLAGVVICSKQLRLDNFKKVIEMINSIPLLKTLNSQGKLIFIYINQTSHHFVLSHSSFTVRKDFQSSFNVLVRLAEKDALLEKQDALLEMKDSLLEKQYAKIECLQVELSKKDVELSKKDQMIYDLKAELARGKSS